MDLQSSRRVKGNGIKESEEEVTLSPRNISPTQIIIRVNPFIKRRGNLVMGRRKDKNLTKAGSDVTIAQNLGIMQENAGMAQVEKAKLMRKQIWLMMKGQTLRK